MKSYKALLFMLAVFMFSTFTVDAGTRVIVDVEFSEGESVEKSTEIVTYNESRFRIDFPGKSEEVTADTPYIMSVDGGENWVIGDKPKDKFYCTGMKTEEFFRNLGEQATDAMEFFNVTAESATVKKILKEPGPEIEGYKTTHLKIETTASAYAWLLFVKFEYSIKVVDDLWYTTELEIHPARKKWLNALTQSGNSFIDQAFSDFTAKLPGPILRQHTVVDITNIRKNETKSQKKSSIIRRIEDLEPDEMDKIFKMPQCQPMDDDEVQDKAKVLFSEDKITL